MNNYTITQDPDAANGLPSKSVDRIEAERAIDIAKKVVDNAERVAKERI